MSISGIELRKQMFGTVEPQERRRQSERRNRSNHVALRPAQHQPPRPATSAPKPPESGRAIADAAVAHVARKLASQTVSETFRSEPHVAADDSAVAHKQLVAIACALSLALFAATHLLPAAVPGFAQGAFGGGFMAFANAVAYPALMVFAGSIAARSIASGWGRFFEQAILPFAIASVLWTAFVALHVHALSGDSAAIAPGMLLLAIAEHGTPASLLALMPAFLLLARLMRKMPVALVLVAAAALEIFSAGRSDMIVIMAARGLVYFLAGCLLASELRRLGVYLRREQTFAIQLLAVWMLLAGLLLFAPLPQIGGKPAGSLPFATLAIGFSGALAIMIAATALQHRALPRLLTNIVALAGRNWLAVYVAFAALTVTLASAEMQPPVFVAHIALCIALLMFVSAVRSIMRGPDQDANSGDAQDGWRHRQARERLVLHLKGL